MSDQQLQLRFLSLAAVIDMTGVSKTSIYAGIQDFPKAIKIHGAGASVQSGARWVESEIIDWMKSRIELRDKYSVPPPAQGKRPARPTKAEQMALNVSRD
jgi:predicted DNA-binding transcriptional regulator AlpA